MRTPQSRRTPKHPPQEAERGTVLILEDHRTLRELLCELFRDRIGLRPIEAGDVAEALTLARRHRPSLAIVDIGLPGSNGLDFLRRARREMPGLRMLVLSSMQGLQMVRGIIQAGANGYVDKSSSLATIRQASAAVLAGRTWFDERFNALLRKALSQPSPDAQLSILTPREHEVLLLVTQSHSSKEVAVKLGVSIKTAENHRTNLMRKLGIHDTAALVRFAIRHDLVDSSLI
jgi:DNA-binding NarL/FixJ family response regulator